MSSYLDPSTDNIILWPISGRNLVYTTCSRNTRFGFPYFLIYPILFFFFCAALMQAQQSCNVAHVPVAHPMCFVVFFFLFIAFIIASARFDASSLEHFVP